MGKISISVVCPTYNSEKYIKRTLEMLLKQKKLPNEVIFCDDGSNDNTLKILNIYSNIFKKKKVRFKLIKSRHKGPGSARNKALNKVSSEYICFLDSDDTWNKNKIYILKKYIRSSPKKNFFIHWETFIKKNNKKKLKHAQKINSKKDLFLQLYQKNSFSTSAVTCKKKSFKGKLKFDISLPNAQDYDLWLKISKKIKLQIIPLSLGSYIDRKDNITNRYYFKKILSLIKICFRYRSKVPFHVFILKLLRILFSSQWLKVNY